MNVEEIRSKFPITESYNFQDHAAVAPLCRPAAEAMADAAVAMPIVGGAERGPRLERPEGAPSACLSHLMGPSRTLDQDLGPSRAQGAPAVRAPVHDVGRGV